MWCTCIQSQVIDEHHKYSEKGQTVLFSEFTTSYYKVHIDLNLEKLKGWSMVPMDTKCLQVTSACMFQ